MGGALRSQEIESLRDLDLELGADEEAVVSPITPRFNWSYACFSQVDIAEAVYHGLPLSYEDPPRVKVEIRPRRFSGRISGREKT